MSYKVIAALGDSVVAGYWDETFAGWFGRLAAKISAAYPRAFGFTNIAHDGDRICDTLHRYAAEGISRDAEILIITASGNDLIRSPSLDSPQDLSPHVREEYWNRLLDLARKNADRILVMDCLPRLDDSAPFNGWFGVPMYEPNSDRVEYNDQIAKICAARGIAFFRRYDAWLSRDLSKYYVDSSHPNGVGHELIADEVFEELSRLGFLTP